MTRKYPDPAGRPAEQLDDLTLLACLVAGEARGEPYEGKIAVAWVVRNRVAYPHPRRFGTGWKGVMLRAWQFSCFNDDDPNVDAILNPYRSFSEDVWGNCIKAAFSVFFALEPDPTDGADHYYAKSMTRAPSWVEARKPVADIGGHLFFRLV